MAELTSRKPNRLQNYDYSKKGMYFITICVQERHEMLWKPVGANCVRPQSTQITNSTFLLSDIGNIIKNEIDKLSAIYPNANVDKYVIMPNHVHMIINLSCSEKAWEETRGRTQFAPTISRIIKQFKGSITKQIGFSIWQKSFHDHIIRDEQEYKAVSDYIDQNPQKWQEDCYFVRPSANP
ncbi:transposase [Acetanaerobacterium elongatum]|uniref:REP element-mobilizing transposase RayT n=1 Tax=Acetanaerobacterium elongatum TaxID=258515 RepID=A0A1G9V3J1_9FIRM|nr:transposase [Acetanaerobacterium elongatum]SDM66627.1 REP element-mobilizing transposase RayT [Acetanaerobacterium elongatum]